MISTVMPPAASAAAAAPAERESGGDSSAATTDTTDIIISCENIHKTYLLGLEGIPALRGVSVDINRGEMLVIYGTSGGGKSTLLNVLGTIDVPTKGNLSLMGTRVHDRTEDSILALLRCRRIGFVFQSFNLLSTMTAIENVSLPMIIAGDRSPAEIDARARQLLVDVGLGHRFDHHPSQLSGGEQQRVTIARALANEPDVLLLDEPTGDLDTRNTHLIMSIFLNLNTQKGLTMIMVTHDVYMKQYASRLLYLRDGKVSHTESNDTATRMRSIEELNRTVSIERAQAKLPPSRPETQIRVPTDYATYSTRASSSIFRQHENPHLFSSLFPASSAAPHAEASGDREMRAM